MLYKPLKLKGKLDHLPNIIAQNNLDYSRKYHGILRKIHNSMDIELCRIPLKKQKNAQTALLQITSTNKIKILKMDQNKKKTANIEGLVANEDDIERKRQQIYSFK